MRSFILENFRLSPIQFFSRIRYDSPKSRKQDMRIAVLYVGEELQWIDHAAPLAAELQAPLLISEPLQQDYYPGVEIKVLPDLHLRWMEWVSEYDALISFVPWDPGLLGFLRSSANCSHTQFIFCPHGQSDKGFKAHLSFFFMQQEAMFVYGPRMLKIFKKLRLLSKNCRSTFVGNYRYAYYQKHREFYSELVRSLFFKKLDSQKRTLLYAPTWQDGEQSTSFFSCATKLIKELPDRWNLVIKPHPLLEERCPESYYPIAALAEKTEHVALVESFASVYPILDQVDGYIGDFSSVGYDFLKFEKPMFFLNPMRRAPQDPSRHLHRCGIELDLLSPYSCIEKHFDRQEEFKLLQRALYQESFAAVASLRDGVASFFSSLQGR